MARRKTEVEFDPEVHKAPTIDLNVLEIRGRDDKWHVFYPQAENISTKVPVYDQDGKLKDAVDSWVATNKYTEVHEVYPSLEAAKDAAEGIHPGCEIKVIKVGRPGANLHKKKEGEND